MRRTDWDLRMPVARWAYMAMWKNLSVKMVLKTISRVKDIIVTAREDQGEEII